MARVLRRRAAPRAGVARTWLDPRFAEMEYDEGPEADARFEAWRAGRTGYPFVDAGMRQLLAEGWMHNRVRMVVASFLVKDLHLPWQRGARWFMRMLRDADLASNQHGWQWTAGCGTDAAPYFRVFNPVTQGLRFDPSGDYVRRYVPELRDLPGAAAHEPWDHPLLAVDYPAPSSSTPPSATRPCAGTPPCRRAVADPDLSRR
ncbi:MAG: FAD-binding domain-containing protein [Candidatus Nanopelagicales bacterium]